MTELIYAGPFNAVWVWVGGWPYLVHENFVGGICTALTEQEIEILHRIGITSRERVALELAKVKNA